MGYDPTTARAFYQQYTVSELETLRGTCLTVYAGSGRQSISFEGSSVTVDPQNCRQVLADVMEALDMHERAAAGLDPELARQSSGISPDFTGKRLS